MADHDLEPSPFHAWLLASASHALLPLLVVFLLAPEALPRPPTGHT